MDDHEARRRMARVQELRPEEHRPWEAVRPDGCTLLEAIHAFVPEVFRAQVSMHLAQREVGLTTAEQDASSRMWMWRCLVQRLRQGELMAWGHLPGAVEPIRLLPSHLDDAEPDFARNRLAWHQTVFAGVRVLGADRPAEAGRSVLGFNPATVTYASGSPGRPSSSHLYRAELESRINRGELATSLAAQAGELHDWLMQTHPQAHKAQPATIENNIRDLWRSTKTPTKR